MNSFFLVVADVSSVVAQAMATYKTISDKQEQVYQLEAAEQESLKNHTESSPYTTETLKSIDEKASQ